MGAQSNLGVFSSGQLLVASAESEYYVDVGYARHQLGVGVPIYICIRVAIAFNNATSYAFELQTDSNANFTTNNIAFPLRPAILIATLVAGYWVYRSPIPYEATQQYMQLYYTEAGSTEDEGAVDAWLSLRPPSDIGANAQTWVSPVGNPAAPA